MNETAQTLPLLIYGTGTYAKMVLEISKSKNMTVSAACVDTKYYNENFTIWEGLPIYTIDKISDQFNRFNVVIGFYDVLLAKDLTIVGCENIFYLDNASELVPISNFSSVEKQLQTFFKNDTEMLKMKACIQLYFACLHNAIEYISRDPQNDNFYLSTINGLKLVTNRYFGIFDEIFCKNQYDYYKNYAKGKYLMVDIGANRGYSALYFAQDENCEKVFSFEPDIATIEFLYENLKLNPNLAKKIKAYNYGLYDRTKMLTFYQTKDGSDGVNSSETEFTDSYWSSDRKNLIQKTKVKVRHASEAIKEVLSEFEIQEQTMKIIKIDIEGAEYKVLNDLMISGLLKSFEMIFGGCHLGIEGILEICNPNFNLVYLKPEPNVGCFNFLLLNKSQKA